MRGQAKAATNAARQTSTSGYTTDAAGGYGLWLRSLIDANGQEAVWGYDAVGNVLSVQSRFPAGTDNHAFCYDEQNRLTWASSTSGAPPCGGSLSSGSLSSANYGPVSFAYDTLDRMTSNPSGTSVFDPHHLHAVSSMGSIYSAAYDAAGNMTCRAPSSSSLCTPTAQNGQLLTYDNEGRTTAWQNAPSNPTSTQQMAYDGEGNRVALVTTGGTPTYYVGKLEEVSGSSITKYVSTGLAGLPVGERVGTGGAMVFLVSEGLNSLEEALTSFSGTVTFQQLFTPYGTVRYTSGTPPTSFAFTGQRSDGASGLDYYHARYYDPVARQFASADTASDGLNRYGYVHGNPETLTDPSGQRAVGCNYGDGKWYCPPPPPPPPTTTPPTGCTTNCGGGGNPPGGTPPGGCSGGCQAGTCSDRGCPIPAGQCPACIDKIRADAQQFVSSILDPAITNFDSWRASLLGPGAVIAGLGAVITVVGAVTLDPVIAIVGAAFAAAGANVLEISAGLQEYATEQGDFARVLQDESEWEDSQFTYVALEAVRQELVTLYYRYQISYGVEGAIGAFAGPVGVGAVAEAAVGVEYFSRNILPALMQLIDDQESILLNGPTSDAGEQSTERLSGLA